MSVAYFNGQFMPLEEVRVSPLDRGYLFGDGVYEVVPAYGGKLFRLDEHLDRLERSMAAIELANPLSRAAWCELLQDIVARNGLGEQSVYLQVTRGVAERNHAFPSATPPSVFIMSKPVAGSGAQAMRAITRVDNRWERCDVKAIALLANCLHKQAAVKAGAGEAILLRDAQLTEGSSSNVFVISAGRVATPPKSNLILAGITRDVAIELMRDAQIPVAECAVSETQLRAADEVWVTSSTMEITPVVELDGVAVGGGVPGPLWHRVDELLQGLKRSLTAA
jgi:D-alanine transaminase